MSYSFFKPTEISPNFDVDHLDSGDMIEEWLESDDNSSNEHYLTIADPNDIDPLEKNAINNIYPSMTISFNSCFETISYTKSNLLQNKCPSATIVSSTSTSRAFQTSTNRVLSSYIQSNDNFESSLRRDNDVQLEPNVTIEESLENQDQNFILDSENTTVS